MSSSSYVLYQPFSDAKDDKPTAALEDAGPVTRFKTRQKARWDNYRYDKSWRPEGGPNPTASEGHFVATLLSQAWMETSDGHRQEVGGTSGSETDESVRQDDSKIVEGIVEDPLAQTLLALIGRRNGAVESAPSDGDWQSPGTATTATMSPTASSVQDIVSSLATATQQVVQQQRMLISQLDETLTNFLSATFSDTTSPENVNLVMEQQERILQQQSLALEIATHRFSMFRRQLAAIVTKKRAREPDVKAEDDGQSIKCSNVVPAVAGSAPPSAVVSSSPRGTASAPFSDDCRISRSLPPSGSYWQGDSTSSPQYGMSDPEGSCSVLAQSPQPDGLMDLKSNYNFKSEEHHNAWSDVMAFKRKKNKGEKIHLANTTHYCSMCQSNMTPQWRYLSTQRFCNACYMRLKRSMASKGVTMQSLKRFAAVSNQIIGAVSDVQREAATLTQAMLAPPLAEQSMHTVMGTSVDNSMQRLPDSLMDEQNLTSHLQTSIFPPPSSTGFGVENVNSNFLGGFTT